MKEKIYNWMLENLPFKLMYKEVPFGGNKYTVWVPRLGWSKKQLMEAEKRANEKYKNIKFE